MEGPVKVILDIHEFCFFFDILTSLNPYEATIHYGSMWRGLRASHSVVCQNIHADIQSGTDGMDTITLKKGLIFNILAENAYADRSG
jgi:hypothetical protein